MKAVVCHRYGDPDALRCEDVPTPTPAEGELLIRVRAAALNPLDWHLTKGQPYISRIFTGLRRPKSRPGRDLAGVVEAVGPGVTGFRLGDAVYGASANGTCAEYVCAKASKLARKPANISFEQAAAVPVAGITALQGLRDKGRVAEGQRVLVNGASGGVGTFAVQIARAFGARVTGVCSTRNLSLVRSLGADDVFDYTQDDFTRSQQRYHLLFDNILNHSFADCRRVLEPGGMHVVAGGPAGAALAAVALSPFTRGRVVPFLAVIRQADLLALNEMMEAGKVTPVIDRCYPLHETAAAMRHLASARARGKIIVSLL